LTVISCGANVAFKENDIFFGSTTEFVDKQVSVIPDFIANCGMARVFAYLMQKTEIEVTDEAIFNDISHTIYNAIKEIHAIDSNGKNMVRTALNVALEKLVTDSVIHS
jgi:glutamate dehydrogenase/leucine dehydrogenase